MNFDFPTMVKMVLPQFFKDQKVKKMVEDGLDFVIKSGATNDLGSIKNVVKSTGATNAQIERIAGYVQGFKLPNWASGFAATMGGQKGVADKIRMLKSREDNPKEDAPRMNFPHPTKRTYSKL